MFGLIRYPQDMPLFSVRSASSWRYITYAHFGSFLARVIKAVGLESTSYSPHSFRRGGATFAFEAKVQSELIKAQDDWRSDCYLIYLEMTDRQKRAAATGMAAAISHIAVQFSNHFFLVFSNYGYHSQPHITMFGPLRFCLLTSRLRLVLLVNKLFCPNIVVCVRYY